LPLGQLDLEGLRGLVGLVLVDEDDSVVRQAHPLAHPQVDHPLDQVRTQGTLERLPQPLDVHDVPCPNLVRVLLDQIVVLDPHGARRERLDLDQRVETWHCSIGVTDEAVLDI
jgi:hypothetical protein